MGQRTLFRPVWPTPRAHGPNADYRRRHQGPTGLSHALDHGFLPLAALRDPLASRDRSAPRRAFHWQFH